MKKLSVVVLSVILLITTGCGPGSGVQVNTPDSTIQLSPPGPNPLVNQPDEQGRIARAVAGLWHGLIAPVTLIMSFFDSETQMYEVHNSGPEYNLGFLLGMGLVMLLLGLLGRMRR
jgi:hypothetical protein